MNLELLTQYRSIKQEIDELQERIKQVYLDAMFPKSPQITGMPRASGYSNNGMVQLFERIEELTEFYKEKQAALNAVCMEIEKEIEALPSLERRIIRLRYLEGKEWSEIGKMTGCSRATLYRLHKNLIEDDASRNVIL